MNTKALTAEFVGTFALIFIGAGAGAIGVGGLVGVALAHGLVLLVVAAAYGPISGAHINPAVTIALWAGRQIKAAEAVGYIVVQLLGGIVAAFVLRFALGGTSSGLGATVLASGVSPAQALVGEAVLTFFLVNTIYNTAVSGKAGNLAPVAIGMTLAFSILMGGPLTGGSLNPARTLGPAVATGNYSDLGLPGRSSARWAGSRLALSGGAQALVSWRSAVNAAAAEVNLPEFSMPEAARLLSRHAVD